MKRVDFLYSLFASSALALCYVRGYEDLAFYTAIGLIPVYALMTWLKQMQINLLMESGNFSGKEFNEKYKDLPNL